MSKATKDLESATTLYLGSSRLFAFRSLAFYLRGGKAQGVPDAGWWNLDNLYSHSLPELLGEPPLEIFDLSGRLLFYEWRIRLRDGRDLGILTSADARLGYPVISLTISAEEKGIEQKYEDARRTRDRLLGGAEGSEERWICFDWPRIGLLVEMRSNDIDLIERGGTELLTFDWRSLPPSPLDSWHAGSQWKAQVGGLVELWKSTENLVNAVSKAESCQKRSELPDVRFVRQINSDYCVPATGSMVLYGIKKTLDYTQQELAGLMSTKVTTPPGQGGTTLKGELQGYSDVLGPGKAHTDHDPTFQDATNKIGVTGMWGRPFKAGTGTHAVAVVGWQICSDGISIKVFNPEVGSQWVVPVGFANFVYVG